MNGTNFTPLADRFAAQYSKAKNGCWEWFGCVSRAGYGQIKDHYRTRRAHRVSYELHVGPIPAGLSICHTCDNRKCVNPKHLFAGTAKENTLDSVKKGRHPAGEKHNKAKLNWKIVKTIRESTEDARVIARRLGVSFSTVYRVRNGSIWNANRRQAA